MLDFQQRDILSRTEEFKNLTFPIAETIDEESKTHIFSCSGEIS